MTGFQIQLPSPLQEINDVSGCKLSIKRDDLLHPIISGNKWRKAEGYITIWKQGRHKRIHTKGSVHSNYVHAIAFICTKLNIPLHLDLYGYLKDSNPLLDDLRKWRISHSIIQRRTQSEELADHQVLYIPEGADGPPAELGMVNMLRELPPDFDACGNVMAIACGTGRTLRSVIQNTQHIRILACSPVRQLNRFEHPRLCWIDPHFSLPFAGYHKELITAVDQFYFNYKILLDPIYTGRLWCSIMHNPSLWVDCDRFIFLHSGGLQGWRSYLHRYPALESEFSNIADIILQHAALLAVE